MSDYYSDRTRGPVPRDRDELPEKTRAGLVDYVAGLVDRDWFAEKFPQKCEDGNSVCGTRTSRWEADVEAVMPGIPVPLNASRMCDMDVFDLLEYAFQGVSKPKQGRYHDYWKHYEYTFDRRSAVREYRERVNELLDRGGVNFEMDDEGKIQRRGSAPVQRLLHQLRPNTGDDEFDNLIRRATTLYTSRDPQVRQDALEKLWDGYERLKTLHQVGDKKESAEILLAAIVPAELRDHVRKEMKELSTIGNSFRIRHSEVGKIQVPDSGRDYLFSRMGELLIYLLMENNWLSDGHRDDDFEEDHLSEYDG